MLYRIHRYLAKLFLKKCGFLPAEIKRIFIRHLLRNVPVGEKFCITSELLEDNKIILEDLGEICSSVEYNYQENIYYCKR